MNLDTIMRERFSCRKYSEYVPSKAEIEALLEAARIAPSACNRQPWHFTVITAADEAGRQAVRKAYDREWIATASTYIVVSGTPATAWVRPYDEHNHVDIDIAITTEHICLKATEIGLATCWICNFDPKVLAEELGMGDDVKPMVIIPVGKPAEGTVIPEKTRKQLSETVTWR